MQMIKYVLPLSLLLAAGSALAEEGGDSPPVVSLRDAQDAGQSQQWTGRSDDTQQNQSIADEESEQLAPAQPAVIEHVERTPDTNALQAASNTQLDRLQRQMTYFNDQNFPEQIHRLEAQISKLQGMIEIQMNQIQSMQNQMSTHAKVASVQQAFSSNHSVPAASFVSKPDPKPVVKDKDLEAHQAYQAVFSKLKAKQYAAAGAGLERFVAHYPDNVLAPNAYYWLGEVYFVQAKYAKAGETFEHVYVHFPKSAKASDALYKLAMVQVATNKTKLAVESLNTLKAQYPASSAARLATMQLKQLGR